MKLGPYELGPNDTPQNGVYTGDARELGKAIPDESIDLIFTDPVYQNIDDYRWLAEMAARVLKSDSACLVFVANPRIASILDTMCPPLHYGKILCHNLIKMYRGIPICPRDAKCSAAWTPCLWLEKGNSQAHGRMFDLLRMAWGSGAGHKWPKDEKIAEWIQPLTQHESIVLDPFTGNATVPIVCKKLGRRYLAFEIDPNAAEPGRQRLRNAQLPLPLPVPEQREMTLP